MLSTPPSFPCPGRLSRARLAAGLLIVVLALVACVRDNGDPADPPVPTDTAPPAPTLPSLLPSKPALPKPMLDGVHLSARLPQETLAYARLPNPWHLLGDVVGRRSDSAYGSPPWRSQMDALRAQVQHSARADGWPTGLGSTLALVDSPVELLVLDPDGRLEGDSSLLLSTSLNSSRPADAARLVSEWVSWLTGEPPMAIPIDARGYGEAAIGQEQPLRLQFQAAEQRLYLYWGEGADLASFSSLLGRISSPVSHRARAQIEAADESGRGMLLWLDLQALRPLAAESRAAWRILPELAGSALFAVGSVRQHGQLTVALDELRPEILARLPKTTAAIPVTTAGSPRWAVTAALPSRSEWDALRSWLQDPASQRSPQSAPPEGTNDSAGTNGSEGGDRPTTRQRPLLDNPLDRLDAWLRPLIGVNAGTMLDRIGPELVIWRDAAGQFAALRMRDEEGFDSMLARLNSSLEGRRGARRWNGLDVHEFSLPMLALERHHERLTNASATPAADPAPVEPDPDGPADAPAVARDFRLQQGLWHSLQRVRSRAYWIEEGPFLVFTAVPQSLVDRQSSPAKANLRSWFEDIQATPSGGSILLYSASVDELPRDSYHRMIQLLQVVGDLLQVPVDPYAFPNADEVALPQRGAVALRIGVDGQRLSLSLRYEDLPLEALAEPVGLATALLAGALVSAGHDAYTDHRARIHLLDAVEMTAEHRLALDAFQTRRRRAARTWPELGNDAPALGEIAPGLAVAFADGTLTLQFADEFNVPRGLRNTKLDLRHDSATGTAVWVCVDEDALIEPKLSRPACDSLADMTGSPASES